MIRCYLTGVECPQEDALVLNRREARALLDLLKDRTASLRRVVEQLSPLDEWEVSLIAQAPRPAGIAPRRHRLVCKAVAEAMAPGFPEIQLFLTWPQYKSQAQGTIRDGASKKQQKKRKDHTPKPVQEVVHENQN